MKAEIELCGMEFHAFHGCLESERRNGARYLVDFRCTLENCPAVRSDNLEDTLDYGRIYDIVAARMEVPSNLLEHVAGRIVDAIAAEFPSLGTFSVKVSKENPPVAGKAAWSSVTLEHE